MDRQFGFSSIVLIVTALSVVAGVGCSGENPSGTITSDEAASGNARLRILHTRVGQPTAFALTTAFVVTDEGGLGVGGLQTDDFQIQEDGAPIVAKESAAVILPRTAEPYLTVVLDNTPTVRTSGAVDALVDGALSLVDELAQSAPSARVAVVWFSLKSEVKQAYTNDFVLAKAAIEAYRKADVGTPSTNLHGAIIDSIDMSRQAQKARSMYQREGVLTMGNVVVFTDGADNAAIKSLDNVKAAVAGTTDEVQMVGLKATDELDPTLFKQLGNTPAVIATSADDLKAAFLQKAKQIASQSTGTYVLGYCTPKAAGQHQVTIDIPTRKVTSAAIPFDASGFAAQGGPACSVPTFQTACDGKHCGGLWCGGCANICTEQLQCVCAGGKAGEKCDKCLNTNKVFPGCVACRPEFAGPDCDECSDASRAMPDCTACKPAFTGAKCDECADPNMALPECCDPGKCDDSNSCTTDTCTAGGKCQNTPVADDTPCAGGNLVCKSGECVHYCDTHCGKTSGYGCTCKSDCEKWKECCNATGKAKASGACSGSTCNACN